MSIHKAIKIIMIEKGIKGVDLAKTLNVNRSTIKRNVGEGSNPQVSTLKKYAEALGVKVSDIHLKSEELEINETN